VASSHCGGCREFGVVMGRQGEKDRSLATVSLPLAHILARVSVGTSMAEIGSCDIQDVRSRSSSELQPGLG
jgi:hypothetical protein